MRRGWNIIFGVLGVISTIISLFSAFIIADDLSYMLLLLFWGIFSLVSTFFAFRGKLWAKVVIIILLVILLLIIILTYETIGIKCCGLS